MFVKNLLKFIVKISMSLVFKLQKYKCLPLCLNKFLFQKILKVKICLEKLNINLKFKSYFV